MLEIGTRPGIIPVCRPDCLGKARRYVLARMAIRQGSNRESAGLTDREGAILLPGPWPHLLEVTRIQDVNNRPEAVS